MPWATLVGTLALGIVEMDVKDVVVGLQVIPEGSREDLSTVVDLPDQEGYVLCRYPSGNAHEVHVDDLDVYDEAAEKAAKVEAQEQINQSVVLFEQAFAMLQKACETAEAAHLSISSTRDFDISTLVDVVERNGGSSSSIWC